MIKKNLLLILMFIYATTGLITPTSIQALKTELVTEKLLFTEEEKSLVVQIFTDSESHRLLKTDQIDSPITQSKTPEVIMITDYINPFLALVYLLVAFYYFKLWLTSMLEDININTSKEKILTWVILIAILLG